MIQKPVKWPVIFVLLGCLILTLIFGCSSKLDFDTHHNFGGPTTWSLAGNGIHVGYYNSDCIYAEVALRELQRRAEEHPDFTDFWEQFRFTKSDTDWVREKHGQYAIDNWKGLGNSKFATEYLDKICDSLMSR